LRRLGRRLKLDGIPRADFGEGETMIKWLLCGWLGLAMSVPGLAALPPLEEALVRARAGDAGAQYQVGTMVLMGKGARQDFTQGAKWIEASAKAGLPQALVALANLADVGLGVPLDPARALALRQQAARSGDPTARGQLEEDQRLPGQAEARRASILLDLKQVSPAIPHAQQAAAQGNPNGLFLMGWFNHGGNGMPVNLAAARSFYRKAADKGHSEAARGYAYLHEFGQGGPVDRQTALHYYDQSAKAGNGLARRAAANLRSPDYDVRPLPSNGSGTQRWSQVPCMTPGAKINYAMGGCDLY
jgi:TPR repeat protein